MSIFDVVVGKPIATTEERAEHIGPIAGIPVFGLDALSSAAYGPEAALTVFPSIAGRASRKRACASLKDQRPSTGGARGR